MKQPQSKKYFWRISSSLFNIIYGLFTILVYNFSFISAAYKHNQSIWGGLAVTICVFCTLYIILSILFCRRLVKTLAIFFCFANTAAFYFMNAYGVVIDKIMLLNVLQTDVYEVADLLSYKMLAYLLGLAFIPSYLIVKTDIVFLPLKQDYKYKLTTSSIAFLIVGSIIGCALSFNSKVLKEHKPLKNSLIPANYIGAIISVTKIKMHYIGIELKQISQDAKMLPQKESTKPNLIVVIIGESARDANFSLSGYKRPTNQPLTKYADELIYFDNFYSCGTATAVSLPCIFSLT